MLKKILFVCFFLKINVFYNSYGAKDNKNFINNVLFKGNNSDLDTENVGKNNKERGCSCNKKGKKAIEEEEDEIEAKKTKKLNKEEKEKFIKVLKEKFNKDLEKNIILKNKDDIFDDIYKNCDENKIKNKENNSYDKVIYLKYLSDLMTVSMKTIFEKFLDEIKNLVKSKETKNEEELLIAYSDLENAKKEFEKKYLNKEGILSLIKEILGKLDNGNILKDILYDRKSDTKLIQNAIILLSDVEIFNNLNENLTNFKFNTEMFNTILKYLIEIMIKNDKNKNSYSENLKNQLNNIDNIEFKIELNLNDYNKQKKGFTIEDYILIFKFIDFCNGNLDIFNKSSELYNIDIKVKTIKDKVLSNLAGSEIIEKLEKDKILEKKDNKYTIVDKYKNTFKEYFKLKFSDLKYIFEIIDSIDIYMYFDKVSDDNVQKRYDNNKCIYSNIDKKCKGIIDNINNLIYKFNNETEKKNILDKIEKRLKYLYCGSEESKIGEVINRSETSKLKIFLNSIKSVIFNDNTKILNHDKTCTHISKLNIILNRNYFGIYCDQQTRPKK